MHKEIFPCFQKIDDFKCNVIVLKTLNCGHQINIQCYQPINNYKCITEVLKKLNCGHYAKFPCFERIKILLLMLKF